MTDLSDIVSAYGSEAALELLLLRQKVSGVASVTELEEFLATHPVSPVRLAHRLSTHHLGGLLFPLLPASLAAQPDMAQLGRSVSGRNRYNLLLLSEMLRIQELCRSRQIDVIFIKGVLLSKILCDDYTSRTASDLDILVRMEDFMRMRELLIMDGYQEQYPFPKRALSYYLQYQREAAFARTTETGVQLHVEIQWSVLPAYYRMPYGNEYFFRHTVDTHIGQAAVTTLDHTRHLLLLLAHHGAGDLWRNLRHLADIALFVQRYGHEINWPEIDAQAKRWGIWKATACGFAMIDALVSPLRAFQISQQLSPNLIQRCLRYVLAVPMLPKRRTHHATFLQQMRLCDSGRDQLALMAGFLKRYCSPGMDELALVKLPRLLFPAYVLIRQFRFAYKGRKSVSDKPDEDGL